MTGAGAAGEGRRALPAVPAIAAGPPTKEAFERLLVRGGGGSGRGGLASVGSHLLPAAAACPAAPPTCA